MSGEPPAYTNVRVSNQIGSLTGRIDGMGIALDGRDGGVLWFAPCEMDTAAATLIAGRTFANGVAPPLAGRWPRPYFQLTADQAWEGGREVTFGPAILRGPWPDFRPAGDDWWTCGEFWIEEL